MRRERKTQRDKELARTVIVLDKEHRAFSHAPLCLIQYTILRESRDVCTAERAGFKEASKGISGAVDHRFPVRGPGSGTDGGGGRWPPYQVEKNFWSNARD